MIACLVAALAGAGAEAFCLSVFFLVWMMRIAVSVGTRWLETEPDTVLYFAPWVRTDLRISLLRFIDTLEVHEIDEIGDVHEMDEMVEMGETH